MNNIELNQITKTYMERAARWAKFLAFFGFFIIGLSVINFIILLVNNPSVLLLVFLIIYIIMLIPCLYLYYFSQKISMAILENNTKKIELAFKNLARFFHFISMLVLIIITLNILTIFINY